MSTDTDGIDRILNCCALTVLVHETTDLILMNGLALAVTTGPSWCVFYAKSQNISANVTFVQESKKGLGHLY